MSLSMSATRWRELAPFKLASLVAVLFFLGTGICMYAELG